MVKDSMCRFSPTIVAHQAQTNSITAQDIFSWPPYGSECPFLGAEVLVNNTGVSVKFSVPQRDSLVLLLLLTRRARPNRPWPKIGSPHSY